MPFPEASFRSSRCPLWLIPLLFVLSGCKVELYNNLDERQTNEVLAALLDANVRVAKAAGEEGTWRVLVEESQFAQAMRILESRGLPRQRFDSFGEVFKKSGILSSPLEERARYVHALSQELSRTICEVDGVLTARVHIVLPQQSELGGELSPASVSVFVKYNEGVPFDIPARTADIRKLVEGSTQGLSADHIHVVMCPSAAAVEAAPVGEGRLIEVLGIRTAPESALALTVVLCVLGGTLVVVLGGGGWLLYRRLTARKATGS